MAFPKLLQRLFTNSGAGTKLNTDIIPDSVVQVKNGVATINGRINSTANGTHIGAVSGYSCTTIHGGLTITPETNSIEGGEIYLAPSPNRTDTDTMGVHIDLAQNNNFRIFGDPYQIYGDTSIKQPNGAFVMNMKTGAITYSGMDGDASGFAEHLVTPPCGSIVAFAGINNIPRGWLICNGAELSRTSYANLFSLLGTRWGAGDGSTTFNLPNLEEYYLEGTNSKDWVGVKRDAGLPQLHGQIDDLYGGVNLSVTGVFSTSNIIASGGYSKGGKRFAKLTFDAQAYNSIYGKSTSVYPNAYRVLYLIKSGGA